MRRLLPALLLLATACATDLPGGGSLPATAAPDLDLGFEAEGVVMRTRVGATGFGFTLDTPEGEHVRMGVAIDPDTGATSFDVAFRAP